MNRGKKIFFEKNAFFDPKIGLFCPQIVPKWGPLGGLQGQFWVFEGPRPFGSRNNANKKKFEKFFWPFLAPKGLRKISGLAPRPK